MRVIDFEDGFTTESPPTSGAFAVEYGSVGDPEEIVAGVGIIIGPEAQQTHYLAGSGGAVDISANPQIADGVLAGQVLKLVGTSDTDTVTIENGTGLALNGACVLKEASTITLSWDGSVWREDNRNDL